MNTAVLVVIVWIGLLVFYGWADERWRERRRRQSRQLAEPVERDWRWPTKC